MNSGVEHAPEGFRLGDDPLPRRTADLDGKVVERALEFAHLVERDSAPRRTDEFRLNDHLKLVSERDGERRFLVSRRQQLSERVAGSTGPQGGSRFEH